MTDLRISDLADGGDVQAGDLLVVARGTGNVKLLGSKLARQRLAAPAYAVSITPDALAGAWQTITVTNATAFTVNAPANPPDASHSAELTIEIVNNAGAAMGAITWDAAFVFQGFVWANPANGKKRFARFEWNGAKWVCVSMASADY